MRYPSAAYDELRAYVEALPLIDSHDHAHALGPNYQDPIVALFWGYSMDDLASASSEQEREEVFNAERSLAERWPALEQIWRRFRHTGYGELVRHVLGKFYGEDKLTLEALQAMQSRLLNVADAAVYEGILEDARIPLRIVTGTIGWEFNDTAKFMDGRFQSTPRGREVILLQKFLNLTERAAIDKVGSLLDRRITSLGEYVEACREVFTACKARGAIGFKDIRAYIRPLACTNPTYSQAEAVFNRLQLDARQHADYPAGLQPLEDYLLHEFMRMARDLELPVQVHTGHMAGLRNDVSKANAIDLIPLLELHRDTKFDLFHANWPYSGEILFIGKNYPNVLIDFCWTNIIDPIYCQRMLCQALSCVPHGKIHAFGADFGANNVDKAWAHAAMTRDHIASALAEMIDRGCLDLDDAREVAADWMFHNLNRFFNLGLKFDDYLGRPAPVPGSVVGLHSNQD